MQFSKSSLRNKAILERKKKYLTVKKDFDYKIIFKLIKKSFIGKQIVIAGYYPSNY